MRIIHSSGKELKLEPGTVLEMERTNPFFNDYGEQSLPVKLPNDPINRQILKYPDDLAVVEKMPQRADAVIQEGAFHIRCRQAILSAGKSDKIDSSFDIESFLIKNEEWKSIWNFIKKKKNQDIPKVFYLYYKEEMTIKEISKLLNTKESYIKNLIYRTLNELCLYFKECD